ncbi:MAG: hypothetical protein HQL08_10470 [Nitrospirae bacterium]|nr:hypothetical protein [Nitrospirota bacterium]
MPCKGQIVTITGNIDCNNVFSHTCDPQLPYEKIILTDGKNSIDVNIVASNSESIFKTIFDNQGKNTKAYVRGIIIGADMPTMNSYRRGILLELRKTEDIVVKKGGSSR